MMLMTSASGTDRATKLATDADQHLRLDGQHDDVGVLDRARVVLDRPDRVAADQLGTPIRPRVAGDDPIGRDLLATDQAGNHGLGHHSRADGGDRGVSQRHAPEYRSVLEGAAPARQALRTRATRS